jgi:hypothetical protein
VEIADAIRLTRPDSHIPPQRGAEIWHRRTYTGKSGTIVIAATNGLAQGRCDDIHANAMN